jgi:anti-anti-sigma factor
VPLSPEPFAARLAALDDGIQLITCHGELDLDAAPALDDLVHRSSADRLVIDLSGVPFMDATGIRVLLGTLRRYPGWRLSVCCPSSPPRRMLAVTGIEDLLLVRDSVGEAAVAVAARG